MSLVKKIDADVIIAMKSRDAERLSVLRMLKSSIKYAAIKKGGADVEIDDGEVVSVVRSEIKKRKDSVESFEKGGRMDIADKEREEIKVLEVYLPVALSDAEVDAIVKAAITEVGESGKSAMGLVMKIVKAKAEGRVDGKTLSSSVLKNLT